MTKKAGPSRPPRKKSASRIAKGMSQAEFGKHIDVSQQRVQQMIASGTIEVMSSGRIDADIARLQYIRSIRRSPGSEEARRVAAARAREIEIRNLQKLNQLIEIEDVLAVNAEILGTLSREFAGIPAAATRDLDIRAEIERRITGAIGRAKASFDKAAAALGEGKPPLSEDEGGDGNED